MTSLASHLVLALRTLRRQRAFAVTAMLTLALGIGATTAIFSVTHAVLLEPLPYPDADRLVLVWGELRARDVKDFPMAPGDWNDLREGATLLEEVAGVIPGRQPLRGDGLDPEQVASAAVTQNFLGMLGARLVAGRHFTAEDVAPVAPPPPVPGAQPAPPAPPPPQSVILGHGLWQRRFGGDPDVIGRRIDLGFGGGIVVGVLAPGFELLWPAGTGIDAAPDVYTAARFDWASASRINVSLRAIGRMKPGVTVEQATAQLDGIAADLRRRFPVKETAGLHWYAERMHEDLVADVRPAILVLMGAVAFVLLIACANVANLLLVRAAARDRELTVRAALGGTRGRLMLPLLGEVLVLAGGGALLGVLLAHAGIRVLVATAPEDLPRLAHVGIDPSVLAFTMGTTVLAALAFGLVPVLRASRPDLAAVLRAGRTEGLTGGRMLRRTVVAVEVALSFVLLVGGGLMVRSFVALQRSDPGFDPSRILTFTAGAQSPQAEVRGAFLRQLEERLRALPGVTDVAATSGLPLSGDIANARWGTEAAAADPSLFQQADVRVVRPGYFAAMRTRVVAGRDFTAADDREDATGIVIDEVLAQKAFPGRSAVGQRLLVRVRGPEAEPLEVIGVVAHQRNASLAADGRETIYFSDGFMGTGAATTWAVRATGDPVALAPAVRRAVGELDARVPVAELRPMREFTDRAAAPTRFALALIGGFAGIAAVLACVGLYGVLATSVRQRTTELGVRIALGAPTSRVFGLVIADGLLLTAIGLVAGLAAALALTRIMQGMLVGVAPTDPATFAAVVALFMAIAAVASWAPARRAASLDPTTALRGE